jgi:Putative transposase
VLHTWGRELQYHPHIHYLVPGGALSGTDQQWHSSSAGFYLPVHALSAIFRGKFRDAMAAQGLLSQIPAQTWDIAWNVNCQAVGDGQATLAYLARYVFKVAISERRIVSIDDQTVRFRYRKVHSNRPRTMSLPIAEFMRRFLQHVLPTGFVKVRYFGFLSHNCALPIEQVRARIEMAHGFALAASIEVKPRAPMRCAHCGGLLRFVRVSAPMRLPPVVLTAIPIVLASGP